MHGDCAPASERVRRIEMASRHSATTEITRSGITMGSALAMILSYNASQSILWAILHGIFSWLYVIYFVIVR